MNILVETGKFSRGDSPIIDQVKWKKGLSHTVDYSTGPSFIYGYEIIPPELKALQEAKGLVTADYQTYLEEKWISELRTKYNVVIYEDVLSTLK